MFLSPYLCLFVPTAPTDPSSHFLQTEDEKEARAPSSPSLRKRRRRTARRLLLVDIRVAVPSVPPILLLPHPALPPGSGSILTSPLEERKRPGLLHLLPRGKGGGEARGAPLLRVVVVAAPPVPLVPLLLPLLLPLLPPPTPSAQMCILLLCPTG